MKPSTSLVTYHGQVFDYINPTPEMVEIDDILMSLPRLNRFLGHSTRAYSVGEHTYHCLVMAEKLNYSPREKLLVFIHDFTEAYVGDMPSPLKQLIPQFSEIERRVELTICNRIGIEPPTEEEQILIKRIDLTMLTIEMKQLTLHDWTRFFNADIHKNFVDEEDFDLTEAIREPMLKELLKTLFEDLLISLSNKIFEEDAKK